MLKNILYIITILLTILFYGGLTYLGIYFIYCAFKPIKYHKDDIHNLEFANTAKAKTLECIIAGVFFLIPIIILITNL
jgi:hypothetical protein